MTAAIFGATAKNLESLFCSAPSLTLDLPEKPPTSDRNPEIAAMTGKIGLK